MTLQSLLPHNATPLELTFEETIRKAYSIDFAIEALDNPFLMPEAFVTFQAWGWSTDLWDRNWSIEKKRAVAQAWYRLHRKKGTLSGIKEAVRFFNGEVVAARLPPDSVYPDPMLTKADRDKYLARFRQMRLYDYRSRSFANFGAFTSSAYRLKCLFPGGNAFPCVSDAVIRLSTRAFIYDPLDGEEMPVKRATYSSGVEDRAAVLFEQVLVPGKSGWATFLSATPKPRLFVCASTAPGRRYTLQVDTTYSEKVSKLHVSGITPSERTISVRPRKERIMGSRAIGQLFPCSERSQEFIGRRSDGSRRAFLPPSTARQRFYDVLFLFDNARLADRRNSRTFIGATRLGMPAYNARLTIQTRGQISPYAAQRFVNGCLASTDKSRLSKTIEAVRQQKSLRDKVLITTKTMRPATAGDALPLGSINVGAWLRDL
jgi:phage tail-like protein